MKQQIEQLIDRLAGSHKGPVLVGDVLDLVSIAWTEEQQEQQWLDLVKLWFECGTTKSLQEIFGSAEWGQVELGGSPVFVGTPEENKPLDEVPKDPAIKALFEFLLQLNI